VREQVRHRLRFSCTVKLRHRSRIRIGSIEVYDVGRLTSLQ
jgi:hypothetical protein